MQGSALESLQKLILPDRWQAEAIQALKEGRDVVLSAPTGAGKTYVFERWAEQTNFARRSLFTVPTRALANDKYAEWKARRWRVGIVTGDVTIDPEAPVVVATLEAVQGMTESFSLLVVDEYHWLADGARGNHYEGTIMIAPAKLQLLLLSGAVANPDDVAGWLRRLGREAQVVHTRERPVPLEEIEADDLIGGLPRTIQGFWARRVAGALRAGYGPVLVFAPHRQDAERLARQFANELPLPEPLTLTKEQEVACGPKLARLIKARVAYHHSGLTYVQRAGVIEPLAKAGQLRAVVATLGLSAGINFSLRSVMITAAGYRYDQLDRDIKPHDLLQMVGRAGRRGLDEAGFVLVSSSATPLRTAAPLRLKRAVPLPWAFMLRQLRKGGDPMKVAGELSGRFFSEEPIELGAEKTAAREGVSYPCGQLTDTGRARLVRRTHRPFPACRECAERENCLGMSPKATPLWQWQRIGVLDKALRLTVRGEIVASFLGPEGLALAAALADRKYPLDALVFDAANLFAGDRFSGTNPRRLGRLCWVCEQAYRGMEVEGFLERGVPPQYGSGAAEIVHGLVAEGEKARRVLDEHVLAGRGDIDRLMTEWRSLLRQVVGAAGFSANTEGLRAEKAEAETQLLRRWEAFRDVCRGLIGDLKHDALPELPPLTPEQRRVINHRFFQKTNTAGPGGRRG